MVKYFVAINELIRLFASTVFPTDFNYLQADPIAHHDPCGK